MLGILAIITRGGLCKEGGLSADHEMVLYNLLSLRSNYNVVFVWNGLYKKVVFKRWPTKQGFHSRIHLYDNLTISVFHFWFPFPLFPIAHSQLLVRQVSYRA